ncbi:uncharacterized protein CTRU02_207941 [Colletotrichum truncatum]|uniref:Uncharacterized protein n=1 Tax=Colletotrichum truncatum TaxID=5467 RepID=A0ACC3Z299_COLTU|nr:uncharacterized protein CTRU02_11035 [Colletotrichum truncatum]KAF6786537.1 hypothetical protein CTRU02_11035 [Colletotrichum truncatum]
MDPLTIFTSVLAVGGFTLKACTDLLVLVRGLKSQHKDARALKSELSDLIGVLNALLATVSDHPNIDLESLKRPLQRCGKACEEYGEIIKRCTKHSNDSRPSLRDWITQKYLQGDITDFKNMLAAYKSTINIALANANLRIAALSPEALEDYKDMISDTTDDLETYLADVQNRIDRLQASDKSAVKEMALEWQAMLEEKENAQQGLNMCAQLSALIVQAESASKEPAHFSERPSTHKYTKTTLSDAKASFKTLAENLKTHEALIDRQLQAMSLNETLSESVAVQLDLLQQTKETISQCIKVVGEAGEVANERSNVFEDITLADNSYAFSVSTVNDLITARGLNLKGRSRHFGGQMTDETVQKSMEALTQLDAEHLRYLKDGQGQFQGPPVYFDKRN